MGTLESLQLSATTTVILRSTVDVSLSESSARLRLVDFSE
jgi:hypothetical protein